MFLLSSCFVTKKQRRKICKECAVTTIEYVKDSIYIKDTVVSVKPDSSTMEALLECDSFGNVRIAEIESLQGSLVNLQTKLKNNKFKVIAKTDTIKVYVKGNTEIKYRYKTIEKHIPVYKDYWWKIPFLIWVIIATFMLFITFRKTVFTFIKTLIS